MAVPLRCHLALAVQAGITEPSPGVPSALAFGILGFHRATYTSNSRTQSPSLPRDWWLLVALRLASGAAPICAPTSPLQPDMLPPTAFSAFSQPPPLLTHPFPGCLGPQ